VVVVVVDADGGCACIVSSVGHLRVCGGGLRDGLKLVIGLYGHFSGAGSFKRGRGSSSLGAICITALAVVVAVVWVLKSVVTLVARLCFILQVAHSAVLPHHSVHHPPHEQLLVRLEAGGVRVTVPRHLLVHLHPQSTLRAVAHRRGVGAGCTGPVGLSSWVYRVGTHCWQ
jgi:hypothetical protein